MSGLAFDRVAACGGAAFTLLAFSTLAVAPPTPDVDGSATEIRNYLVDEHDRFGVSVALMALAVLALCLALGHVWRRLSAGSRATTLSTTFVIAAAVTASTALAGVLLQGVLAQQATGLDDSTLLALYRTWQVVAFMGPPLPMAIVLALVFVCTLRDAILPRWTGWLALVAAIGGAATAMLNLGSDITAPLVLDLGSFLLTCVWLTAVTVSAFVTKQPIGEPAYAQTAR
jgi:hypothetical protein